MRPIFRAAERIDDPGVVSRPFRSTYFILTSAMGLGCLALAGYILHRYWQYLSAGLVVAIAAVVAAQVLYQVVQVFRVIPMIEEFDAIASDDNLAPDSPLGDAIDAGVRRFVDKLFLSYGVTLGLLVVVAKLLSLRHPA
jgi:hypothetical protein